MINGILQARKETLRVFMIEWEHYTAMAENFCVDKPTVFGRAKCSEASLRHSGQVNTEKFEAIVL